MRARDVLGQYGPFAKMHSRYEYRESQLTMADAVEDALMHDGVLLAEAGTGTGKTLAYLIPAILSEKRVIISTATKTLQDQIMEHDVPLLEKYLGLPVRVAAMKGLSNYLCLRRFEEFRVSEEADRAPHSKHLPILQTWKHDTVIGDRAELAALPDDAGIWSFVTSSPETRIGTKCSYFDACFVTQMKRRAEAAQIIVVNHHLFFADLATRNPSGGILPDYDAVIFDEAHQIEDIATEFFGVRVSVTRVETLVRDARRAFAAAGINENSREVLEHVANTNWSFFSGLARIAEADIGRRPLDRRAISKELLDAAHAADAALEALSAHAKLHASESESISQMARRASLLRDDLASVLDDDHDGSVAWTEARGRNIAIGSSPVDISAIMRDEIFHRKQATIFTSATLSTGGTFDFVKSRLGIDFEIDEVQLASPFHYHEQVALFLPKLPDPRAPTYAAEATDQIRALIEITGGGAFVLCTSNRAMNDFAAKLKIGLKNRLLVQGTAPKSALLDEFKKDGHAVLVATSSFWEGIDVPGEALRLVVIDKLPFDVPSDPLVVARCKTIEEAGGAPFMKYLVPSAAIALKQGFGRLIRTRTDRGVVAILDSRITTKGYGKYFLKSLPDARRTTSIDEIRAFWAENQAFGSASTAVP